MYFKLKKIKISDTYKKKSLNYSSYYIQCFLRYYDHAAKFASRCKISFICMKMDNSYLDFTG